MKRRTRICGSVKYSQHQAKNELFRGIEYITESATSPATERDVAHIRVHQERALAWTVQATAGTSTSTSTTEHRARSPLSMCSVLASAPYPPLQAPPSHVKVKSSEGQLLATLGVNVCFFLVLYPEMALANVNKAKCTVRR